MTKRTNDTLRKTILTFLFVAISVTFGISLGPNISYAQPGQPGYKYPVLTENDFKAFLDGVQNEEAYGQDEQSFYSKYKINPEHFFAIVTKIIANVVYKLTNVSSAEEYGQSIMFNDKEDKLYEQYKSEVDEGVATLLDRYRTPAEK
jgi:hypothetical protein